MMIDRTLKPSWKYINTFNALKNRNYRWYWFSVMASFAGVQMDMLVRGWLVYEITSSSILASSVSPLAFLFLRFHSGVAS
jgi:hypothetical protein